MSDATAVCATCGAKMAPSRGSRPKKWCSGRCRHWMRHYGAKPEPGRICRGCKAPIDHLIAKAVYCTQACGQRARDAVKLTQKRAEVRYCLHCAEPFTPARANSTCCSVRHYRTWFQKRREMRRAVNLYLDFTAVDLKKRLSMFAGCWMCGGGADQIDHVKPIAAGGAHILANLRPACGDCNNRKGAKWPFRAPNAVART